MTHTAGNEETRPIVLVGWVDSGFSFSQGWADHDELVGRAKEWDGYVTTAGYLMYEDERCVVISQSRDGGEGTEPGEPRWASLMLINRANILSMETLTLGSGGIAPPASAPATTAGKSPATIESQTLWDALRALVEYPDMGEGAIESQRPSGGLQEDSGMGTWCALHSDYECGD